mmetsp:Transcript_13699/g.43908  ORF Transcript_13699/g.43908 Transcript_13699/m.43908 type:complete len:222 (+) Transcript_13699:39-704(+)
MLLVSRALPAHMAPAMRQLSTRVSSDFTATAPPRRPAASSDCEVRPHHVRPRVDLCGEVQSGDPCLTLQPHVFVTCVPRTLRGIPSRLSALRLTRIRLRFFAFSKMARCSAATTGYTSVPSSECMRKASSLLCLSDHDVCWPARARPEQRSLSWLGWRAGSARSHCLKKSRRMPGSEAHETCPQGLTHLRLPRPPCSTSDACAATILRACETCSTYACESV